jgi:hypothetical protein
VIPKSVTVFTPPLSFTTFFTNCNEPAWSSLVIVQVALPPFGITRPVQLS